MYGDCEGCSFKGQKYEDRRHGQQSTLFGGFPANLCNQCVIAWHAVCLELPEFKRHREIDVELGAMEFKALSKERSTRDADILADKYAMLSKEKQAITDAAWKKSQAWVAARQASVQPASIAAQ